MSVLGFMVWVGVGMAVGFLSGVVPILFAACIGSSNGGDVLFYFGYDISSLSLFFFFFSSSPGLIYFSKYLTKIFELCIAKDKSPQYAMHDAIPLLKCWESDFATWEVTYSWQGI